MENKFYRILFFLSILLIIISFDLAHNPPGGWQKQMLPDSLSGMQIEGFTFVDSLTGFCIIRTPGYILKSTNAGFNWQINYSYSQPFYKLTFLNKDTGYVLSYNKILKTFNQGDTWITIDLPLNLVPSDIYVYNTDTIWAADTEASVGGVFLTTNGGGSWIRKYYAGGSQNPDKIYFANNMLGFASKGILLRTSDGGNTWNNLQPEIGFIDIHFIDSMTGWRVAMGAIRKTSDGGLNWVQQTLPSTNDTISSNGVGEISKLNKDGTMYAVGPRAFYLVASWKGLIFKTTNGGDTWGYQLPDTNEIKFKKYFFTNFSDNNTGWAYQNYLGGIYTNVGGDTTIYTGVKNISTEVPKDFRLHQNFPNPFNPKTKIRYDVLKRTIARLKIFDIKGREVLELVNEEQLPGTYETEFDASALSSGIYFGILNAEDFKDVIKMILIK